MDATLFCCNLESNLQYCSWNSRITLEKNGRRTSRSGEDMKQIELPVSGAGGGFSIPFPVFDSLDDALKYFSKLDVHILLNEALKIRARATAKSKRKKETPDPVEVIKKYFDAWSKKPVLVHRIADPVKREKVQKSTMSSIWALDDKDFKAMVDRWSTGTELEKEMSAALKNTPKYKKA